MPKVDLLKDLAVGGGAGVGSVDTIGIENFENTSAVDLPRGNDPFYLNGGTFQGELEDIVSNPASGEKHIRYTQGAGSEGDSYEMANFTIQPKEQDRLALIKFVGLAQGGLSGDIRFVAEDNNGDDTLLGTGFRTRLSDKFVPYASLILIPANATSISIGALVENENIAATFEFDDVELTLDTTSVTALDDVGFYSLTQTTNQMTSRTTEFQFDLGTATISDKNNGLFSVSDDSPNNRTIITAIRDGSITIDFGAYFPANRTVAFTKNGSVIYEGAMKAGTLQNAASHTFEVEAGDVLSIGEAGGTGVLTANSLVSDATQTARLRIKFEATSDNVVSTQRNVDSMVRLHTGNGHGSTNTAVRRFSSIALGSSETFSPISSSQTDGAITVTDSPTDGVKFIVGEDGYYAISYTDGDSSAANWGIVRNTSNYINTASGQSADKVLNEASNSAGFNDSISWQGFLKAGDEIIANASGMSFTSRVYFTMAKIGFKTLSAQPNLQVSSTREAILSGNINSVQDINEFQFNNLEIGHTYILSGSLSTVKGVSGNVLIELRSASGGAGELYGSYENRGSSSIAITISIAPVTVFTAQSSTLYVRFAKAPGTTFIQGNGTKGEDGSYVQLTDITSEFLKLQPKNLYGEKILSGNVNSNIDIPDLSFSNLEVGKYYQVTGQVDVASANLSFRTATSGGGDLLAIVGDDNANAKHAINFIFKATTTVLIARGDSVTTNINGNGTKSETYVQLEERNDLEKTAKFN